METIIQGTPVINRLIKISAYGETELLRGENREIGQKQAIGTMERQDKIKEHLKKNPEASVGKYRPVNEAKEVYRQLNPKGEYDNEKVTVIQKALGREYLRKFGEPLLSSFLSAPNNDRKRELLDRMNKEIPLARKQKIFRIIRDYGLWPKKETIEERKARLRKEHGR
jgi:hypothetical protein